MVIYRGAVSAAEGHFEGDPTVMKLLRHSVSQTENSAELLTPSQGRTSSCSERRGGGGSTLAVLDRLSICEEAVCYRGSRTVI